jgi:hypothetical protein
MGAKGEKMEEAGAIYVVLHVQDVRNGLINSQPTECSCGEFIQPLSIHGTLNDLSSMRFNTILPACGAALVVLSQ